MTRLVVTRRTLLGAAAATAAGGLVGRAGAAEPVKGGWVYVGPVGDFGYSYQHDQGRKAVDQHFGDKVKTSFVENVPEGPDAERVIRQLATSYKSGPNLATYNARFYEGRAVIGTIAGHLTKTKKIGYIASFPIPEVVMGINSFTLAMQKVAPDATVNVIWVNSWYDPGKEADAAKAHIDQGADIIAQHTDRPAALQVAEERGLMAFGQSSDMRRFAPNAQLTAIVDNWGPYYIQEMQAVMDGTWKTHNVWLGLKEGAVEIAPYGPKVTPEAAAAADKVKQAIAAGTLHPFQGPVKDRDGKVRIPDGAHASDEELNKMDWYVPGVQA